MVRQVLIPAVLALWGVFIVFNFAAQSHGSGAYASGRGAAAVFGAVMAVVGTRHVLRALRERG